MQILQACPYHSQVHVVSTLQDKSTNLIHSPTHPFILLQLKGEKPEQFVLDTQLSYSSSFHDVVLKTEDALRIYVHGNVSVGDFTGDIVIKDLERKLDNLLDVMGRPYRVYIRCDRYFLHLVHTGQLFTHRI